MADNVHSLYGDRPAPPVRPRPPVDLGGGGPHDPGMESRVAKIEALLPTLATKADMGELRGDLHKMDASIVRWMIATILTLFLGFAGLFFTMSTSLTATLRAGQVIQAAQPAVAAPAPAPQAAPPAAIPAPAPVGQPPAPKP